MREQKNLKKEYLSKLQTKYFVLKLDSFFLIALVLVSSQTITLEIKES